MILFLNIELYLITGYTASMKQVSESVDIKIYSVYLDNR